MTSIVGVVEEDTVWLGSDSLASDSQGFTRDHDEQRVFQLETDGGVPIIAGTTGTGRFHSLLRYRYKLPMKPLELDWEEYFRTLAIPQLRTVAKENQYTIEGSDRALIGAAGKLFWLGGGEELALTPGVDAIGIGKELALGAMFASRGERAIVRIELALKAAATYSVWVRGPFQVISLVHKQASIADTSDW